ncbi:MAG: hypothetical protein HQL96_00655 [Magnetococcales bacterium]|nr:hypothetical protein [Magnetococcales bacterium]
MAKEKEFRPLGCGAIVDDMHTRLDILHQRQAKLVTRMEELERLTRERLDGMAGRLDGPLTELLAQQEVLLRKTEEQEEESARIFINQNELLLSLQESLDSLREGIRQLSERHEALLRRVAGSNEHA